MVKAAHTTWLTGAARRAMYSVWKCMHARCSDKSRADYGRYGGKGISVCERWDSFEMFVADMGVRPSPQHSLDRWPNGAGNYEPGNCRWATRVEQARNKSNNRLIEWRGETRCLASWADLLGVPSERIKDRLDMGWSVDRALTEPPAHEKTPSKWCHNGHLRTEENTTTDRTTGILVCRECNRAAVKRYKQRRQQRSMTGEKL